ncbi:MAG TPA: transcriptional regulator [Geobacteraceae bacterium]
MKAKKPFIPREENATIRRTITQLLEEHPRSVRELSVAAHIPEKEVLSHLEHIRMTHRQDGPHLTLTPASCRKCGFIFSKRERLARPGKCPVCRNEQITPPLYGMGG